MFSKSVVRSRKQIIKGLLTRAFSRSQEDGEKMQLLIEWRLAACNYENTKALRQFTSDYQLDDMRNYVSTGSRGLDAFNFISMLEGRDDTLTDAAVEKRIEDMARMHDMVRFFKNSEIVVDLDAIRREQYLADPKSPILFELPETQPSQRSPLDTVYTKSTKTPAYMKPLSEIDAMVDWDDGTGGSGKGAKKERRQTHGFETAPKPTLH